MRRIKLWVIFILSLSCEEKNVLTESRDSDLETASWSVDSLKYDLLPERNFNYSEDSVFLSFYYEPTEVYAHGILGDRIEAKGVAVYNQEKHQVYEYLLDDQYVFEDLVPRMYDFEKDGIPEIVCIRADVNKGAGIVIFKIQNSVLNQYAWVNEIGTKYRWLNIAAIADLDDDGQVEIAWVQTPHIGGILKFAQVEKGRLTVLDQFAGVSNHAIGSRNLDLSVLEKDDGIPVLYLPTQSRKSVLGFRFVENELLVVDTIQFDVDFSIPLGKQL